MNYDAVIFDMDGVLVDSEPLYMAADQEMFDELGICVPNEELAQYVGIAAERMWQELRDRFSLPQPAAELVKRAREYHDRCIINCPRLPPVEGARELVEALHAAEIPLAVASSSGRTQIHKILTRLDLLRFFPVTVSGQDVTHGKPAPDIFLRAAALLDVPAGRCIVIEDSENGSRGAKAAGMLAIAYANPHSGRQNLERADLVLKDLGPASRAKIMEKVQGRKVTKVPGPMTAQRT